MTARRGEIRARLQSPCVGPSEAQHALQPGVHFADLITMRTGDQWVRLQLSKLEAERNRGQIVLISALPLSGKRSRWGGEHRAVRGYEAINKRFVVNKLVNISARCSFLSLT